MLPRPSTALPQVSFPPSRSLETHKVDGIKLRVYSPEKTLADCFKYRSKIGMDVVLEAIRNYRQRRRPQFQKVFEYAKMCRLDRLIRPYLEALA